MVFQQALFNSRRRRYYQVECFSCGGLEPLGTDREIATLRWQGAPIDIAGDILPYADGGEHLF